MISISISLLSLERQNYRDVPKAKDRLDAIVTEVRDVEPDLLVCAMDFLGSQADVMVLATQLAQFRHQTIVVVDAVPRHRKPKIGKKKGGLAKRSPLMVIEPRELPRELARQLIAEASEKSAKTYSDLVQQLGIRDLRVKGLRVSCLCCGEINFLTLSRTGGQPFFDNRFPEVARHFNEADIILNPTHDLMMARPWITEAKRRFLSRQIKCRSRCYVSVSNWDTTRRGQKRTVQELHTVYVNRHLQRLDRTGFNRYGRSMACSRITISL